MAKEYVCIDDETSPLREVLRQRAVEVQFPLSQEDQTIIDELVNQFKGEPNCVGLAAPQIGFGKRIIVYHISEEMLQVRDDIDELIPPTVLINAEYQPLDQEKKIDWEGCFSVKSTMGEVPRFKKIAYKGQDFLGNPVQGIAQGFFARLLQHEIGHLNGELFIDLLGEGCRRGPIEEMRALRFKEREEGRIRLTKGKSSVE